MAADAHSDALTLSDMLRRLEAAENSGNFEDIAAMLAEDAAIMVPNYPVQQGKAACAVFLRDVLTGMMKEFHRQIAYSSDEVSVLGDWAFDRGTFAFTIAPKAGGEATLECGKYLFLYRRFDDAAWKLSGAIVNLDEHESESQSEQKL
jgi:ketosteroid isomerase-like protein